MSSNEPPLAPDWLDRLSAKLGGPVLVPFGNRTDAPENGGSRKGASGMSARKDPVLKRLGIAIRSGDESSYIDAVLKLLAEVKRLEQQASPPSGCICAKGMRLDEEYALFGTAESGAA